MANAKAKSEPTPYACHFCKKEFKYEGTFLKHLCEKKRRFIDRDLPQVRLGFLAYQRFYKFNYRREPDGEHFRNSKYYSAFVKFGKYMIDVNAVEPMEFAQFVIEKGASLPVDRWGTDTVYKTYIRERTMKESPEAAAERTILIMQQWAIDTGNDYRDFFRKIATPRAVSMIQLGRISPWMLYATASGQELLQRLDPEQVNIVSSYIDPTVWRRRIKLFEKDVASLAAILKEAGI